LYTVDTLRAGAEGLTIVTAEQYSRPVETADGLRNAIDTVLVARDTQSF
jgi:hypothetical protein